MKNSAELVLEEKKGVTTILTPDRMKSLPVSVQIAFRLHEQHKLFAPKYWIMQKNGVIRDVRRLYQENPTLPVKQVVLTILSDLPDFLPSWNVRNVVGFVTEEWKKLSNADEAEEVAAP